MGVNSLPKTVTQQRRDLNPGPSAPESSTLTTRLPSHPQLSNSVDEIEFTLLVVPGATISMKYVYSGHWIINSGTPENRMSK